MNRTDVIRIPLTRGYSASLDLCDSDLAAIPWSLKFQGHKRAKHAFSSFVPDREGRAVAMHVVVMTRVLGRELLPGELVDHIDRDGLNNTRTNLRLATAAQNAQNVGPRNRTGYKGVAQNGKHSWRAQIYHNGTSYALGVFSNKHDAARAYNVAARQLFGEFAYLNIIEDDKKEP